MWIKWTFPSPCCLLYRPKWVRPVFKLAVFSLGTLQFTEGSAYTRFSLNYYLPQEDVRPFRSWAWRVFRVSLNISCSWGRRKIYSWCHYNWPHFSQSDKWRCERNIGTRVILSSAVHFWELETGQLPALLCHQVCVLGGWPPPGLNFCEVE